MYLRLSIFALFVVVAITARGGMDPELTASPNPITVPDGQTQGKTTLTWATEGPEGFLWVSIDGSEEELLTDAGAIEGSREVIVGVGKRYTINLYTHDKEKLLASVDLTVTNSPGPIAPPARNVYPAYIYAISSDGTLKWFRHDGADEGKPDWQGPRDIGTGWNKYKFVFPGGANVIYAITQEGVLQWYRHTGYQTGVDSWDGPNDVGRGWENFTQVFSTGDGIIYAINSTGKLFWFRHNGILSGTGLEIAGAWTGPKEIGRGWGSFKSAFSTGEGIIYAVTKERKLQWYKHNGYLDGSGLENPTAWKARVDLGSLGGPLKQVFSSGNGIIYEVQPDGTLTWLRHLSYKAGSNKSVIPPIAFGNFNSDWQGSLQVNKGWADFTQVFALLPGTNSSDGVQPVKAPGAGGNPLPPRKPNRSFRSLTESNSNNLQRN